jgi:hypothetical protein
VACASFLACLNIYLMVAEEMAWAKRGAKKAGSDPAQVMAEKKDHYWSAWTALLSANATLQLASQQDVGEIAAAITTHAYGIDGRIWNLTHGGMKIANDYEASKAELEALRDRLITAARRPISGTSTSQ